MDDFDREILDILQHDASTSVADIADQVGLSTTPCWRRIQNLESGGVIKARSVELDAVALNLGMTVYVEINAGQYQKEWQDNFIDVVSTIPEIIELNRMSGQTDYLMKVVVPDMDTYDEILRQLADQVQFENVSSSFVMETMKTTSSLPLNYVS